MDFFCIEFVGELRVAGEIGEQHRHLPPLSLWQRRRHPRYRGRRAGDRKGRRRCCITQRRDRGKQFAAVADRGDANPDQIVGGQVGKDLGVNVVLAERLLVLRQSQTVQPSRNVHGCLLARFLRRASPGY